MKKRIGSILLSLALCLTLLPTAALAGTEGNEQTHSHCVCGATHADVGNHKTESIQTWTAWNETASLPDTAGYYYLTDNVEISSAWSPQNGTFLCLNGKSITYNNSSSSGSNPGSVISVGTGVTFTLTDCQNTGTITRDSGSTCYGVYIYIENSSYSPASFNMYGGTITGHNGSGVYVYSKYNPSSNRNSFPACFNMYGGTITNNTATRGGGVYMYANSDTFQSEFNMYGGTISNNTVSRKNYGGYGGGVCVGGESVFTMAGGTICGNKAIAYSANGKYYGGDGGGVGVDVNGEFIMTGGTITNNEIEGGDGGGVSCGSKMTVSGTVNITGNKQGTADNNVYLPSGQTITVGNYGFMNAASRIGVNTKVAATADDPVKIATNASYSSVKYTEIFKPDAKAAYSVSKTDTDLYLVPHTHSYTTYSASGATITATCDCGDTGGGTVTLKAPDESELTYTNSAKTAKVTKSGWKGESVNNIKITYTKDGKDAYPLNAGTYTASITVGGATASVTYTISKKALGEDDLAIDDISAQTYTDSQITPDVTVKFGDKTLTKDKDYTLSYGENTNAGTGTITVKAAANGNYTFKDVTKTFTINRANQSIYAQKQPTYKDGVGRDISEWASLLNGTGALTFTLQGSPEGVTLTENNILTVSPSASVTEFTIQVTAAETANYNSATTTFKVWILDRPKASATSPTAIADLTYNGEEQTLIVGGTATNGEMQYKLAGSEYGTALPKATNAGEYTVYYKAASNSESYSDSDEGQIAVTIAAKTLTKDDLEYTGTAITRTYDGTTGCDMSAVSVKSGVLCGSDTLTVTGTAVYNSPNVYEASTVTFTPDAITTGNYSLAATETLEINASITAASVTPIVTVAVGSTYDGTAKTPDVTVKVGTMALVKDTDYTLTYSNNISADISADTNTAYVTVTAKANRNYTWADDVKEYFSIARAAAPTMKDYTVQQCYSDGSDQRLVIDLTKYGFPTGESIISTGVEPNDFTKPSGVNAGVNSTLFDGTTLTVSYYIRNAASENIGGTVTFPIKIKAQNHEQATLNLIVTLTARTSKKLEVSMSGWTYGDAAGTPGYGTLPEGATNLSVQYKAKDADDTEYTTVVPTNAGNYTVHVSYETATEIWSGTADFTIEKAAQTVTAVDVTATYGDTGKSVSAIGIGTVTYAVTSGTDVVSVDSDGKLTILNAGTATITATAEGDANHNGDTTTITVTVNRATPTVTNATANVTYGDPARGSDITATTGTPGSFAWKNTTSYGDASETAKIFYATFTPNDTTNYNTVQDVAVSVTVGKAAARPLDAITASQKYTVTTGQSKQIGSIMPADAGALSYSVGTASVSGTATVSAFAVDNDGLVKYTITGGAASAVITLPVKIDSVNYAQSTVNVVVALTDRDAQAELTFTGETTVTFGQTLTLSAAGGSGTGAVSYELVHGGTGAAAIHGSELTPTKAGTVKIKAIRAADADYAAAESAVVTITIAKAGITGKPSYTAITTGGKTLADANLSAEGGSFSVEGSVKWVDDAGLELPDNTEVVANTAYKWLFTPTDSDNYNTIDGTVTLWHKSSGSFVSAYPVTVSETENGSVTVSPKSASRGTTVTITATPDAGYDLKALTVLDKNGNAIELTELGGGKYSFKMPVSKVTVNATFKLDKTVTDCFTDVPSSSYYAAAVNWAVGNNITEGTGSSLFGPDLSCTRAQIVTFLWRAAGCPEPKASSSFNDVPAAAYYAKAVAWAVENGITDGIDNNLFAPDQTCTRAQAVAFLFRYAAANGMDAVTLQELVSGFNDASEVPAYALPAFNWALANKIVEGAYGKLLPNDICTRAQIVTMLYRLLGN